MNASCCLACQGSNAANALSIPPGEYGRKIKTQRNRRGPAQAVEQVDKFEDTRRAVRRRDSDRIG